MRRHTDSANRGLRGIALLLLGVLICLWTMPWRLDADRGTVVAWITTLAGLTLLICGSLADRRSESNRTGLLMAAVGIGIFAEDLIKSWQPVLHTSGLVLHQVSTPLLIHTALAYPRGRLEGKLPRVIVVGAYVLLLGFPVAMALVDGSSPIDEAANLLLISNHPQWHWTLMQSNAAAVGVLAVLVAIATARRAMRATPADRRLMLPLTIGVLACASFAIGHAALPSTHWASTPLVVAFYLGLIAFAIAFLALVLRNAGGLKTLAWFAPALTPQLTLQDIEALTARALADSSLQLGTWEERKARFLRPDGSWLDLQPSTAISVVSYRNVALRNWDSGWTDPLLVTAILTLVSAELSARNLALGERAKLARDLHDGAQQHLTALALRLRLLEDRDDLSEAKRERTLHETRAGIEETQAEIRRLSRGEVPGPLQGGLGAALAELAARTPLPVVLDLASHDRVSTTATRLAYFVVAEGLSNALRHAQPSSLIVRTRHTAGQLTVDVQDDGPGGAMLIGDGGLKGLAERLAAAGGTLTIDDAQGCLLRALIPCGEASCES